MDSIKSSYDAMAADYTAWVEAKPSRRLHYLSKLLDSIPSDSSILELGCGAGIPVTLALAQHLKVKKIIANDISSAQIALAKERLQGYEHVNLVEGDMCTLSFPPSSLNGVVAFFSLFHLPRSEQPTQLLKIHSWLQAGGVLVINFGTENVEEHVNDFFGEQMAWSGWGVEGRGCWGVGWGWLIVG